MSSEPSRDESREPVVSYAKDCSRRWGYGAVTIRQRTRHCFWLVMVYVLCMYVRHKIRLTFVRFVRTTYLFLDRVIGSKSGGEGDEEASAASWGRRRRRRSGVRGVVSEHHAANLQIYNRHTMEHEQKLPPGWSKGFSNSQKMWYYSHAETKHTQWHFPTASEASDPAKAKKRAEENVRLERERSAKSAKMSPCRDGKRKLDEAVSYGTGTGTATTEQLKSPPTSGETRPPCLLDLSAEVLANIAQTVVLDVDQNFNCSPSAGSEDGMKLRLATARATGGMKPKKSKTASKL